MAADTATVHFPVMLRFPFLVLTIVRPFFYSFEMLMCKNDASYSCGMPGQKKKQCLFWSISLLYMTKNVTRRVSEYVVIDVQICIYL